MAVGIAARTKSGGVTKPTAVNIVAVNAVMLKRIKLPVAPPTHLSSAATSPALTTTPFGETGK